MDALESYRRDLRLIRRGPARRWDSPIAPWQRAEALERCLRVVLPYCTVQVEVESLPGMPYYTATVALALVAGVVLKVQRRASGMFLHEATAPVQWIAHDIARALAEGLIRATEPP